MSRGAVLSLLGLYEWDNTIFDTLVIPEPYVKSKLIDRILLECAELEVLYANPVVMKKAIGVFSDTYQVTFSHYKAVLESEYSPLDNYNVEEEEVTNYSPKTLQYDTQKSATTTTSGSETESGTRNRDIDSEVNTSNTAYNSDTFKGVTKVETDTDDDITTSGSKTTSGSVTDGQHVVNAGSGTDENVVRSKKHGNIGVTLTQKILSDELALAPELEFYKRVTALFKQWCCLLVY